MKIHIKKSILFLLLLTTGFYGCSSKTVHKESSSEVTSKQETSLEKGNSNSNSNPSDERLVNLAQSVNQRASNSPSGTSASTSPTSDIQKGGKSSTNQHSSDSADKSKTSTHAHHGHGESEGIAPEKALGWLKNGNQRFLKGHFRKDGAMKSDVQKLAKGQHPHSIVFSCADSRVPPEVVFDQKLGEIFVVRNAGEVPDLASIASMEYAVEHLGSKLLVVMGHTSCGAVKAALGTMDGKDAGSPSLNSLVKSIHPHISAFKGKTPSADVAAESTANVRGAIADLLEKSEILNNKVKAGEIKIQGALYHLDDGKVEFLD